MRNPALFATLVLGLGVASTALAWDSRDVEAAGRYRELERERAERFRDEVEQGRVARLERKAPAPQTQARRREREPESRRRERSRVPSAWQREVDRWAEQVEEWGDDLQADLGDAIEQAVRDALEGRDRPERRGNR